MITFTRLSHFLAHKFIRQGIVHFFSLCTSKGNWSIKWKTILKQNQYQLIFPISYNVLGTLRGTLLLHHTSENWFTNTEIRITYFKIKFHQCLSFQTSSPVWQGQLCILWWYNLNSQYQTQIIAILRQRM